MDIYKALGPISIVQLWLCLLFMIRRWPGNKSMTYSAHAAATRSGIVYYLFIFTLHMVLFYLFAINWFVPTFGLPWIFAVILLVAMLGQFIALLVPSTGGRKSTIHEFTAYFMHTLLLPLCLFIVFTGSFSTFARAYALVASVAMLVMWYLFATAKDSGNRNIVLQTVYGLSFHTAILVAMYVV